ncbi:GntP family permease [Alkalicoccus urumqiensis]|uniref:Gluconate:proton symporter n=1 Tax=Alkalicoccus urumqiensis TaxID=1548213 RepID=A0A2P6MGU6_ALKUR|nr:GntP family permease [Alkalicoccus urumqiensis]PRO65509.1 gluconate:proton symporter [Alkalicoccus urumqiensis]
MTITAAGAGIGFLLAVILILIRFSPVYSLLIGAVAGGLIGGADLMTTISFMMEGAEGMVPAVLRVIASGALAGVMIESGAASSIARFVVRVFGEKRALAALAVAAMILTAVGVFIVVAIITVSTIAVVIAKNAGLSKPAILLAMVGGGKAGNLISPNPNTIALADAFDLPLTTVMAVGIPSAVTGILVTCWIAEKLKHKGSFVQDEVTEEPFHLPPVWKAAAAPVTAISLLILGPAAGIEIDPLIALPLGAFVGTLVLGQWDSIRFFMRSGLDKVMPVALLLLVTGAIAGIITNSDSEAAMTGFISAIGLPGYFLAPFTGMVMGGATGSTTAATVISSEVFGSTLLELGISAVSAAAMIHAGSVMIDHSPVGSFFHATAASVHMDLKERLRLFPYEAAVGLVITITATLIYGTFGGWI